MLKECPYFQSAINKIIINFGELENIKNNFELKQDVISYIFLEIKIEEYTDAIRLFQYPGFDLDNALRIASQWEFLLEELDTVTLATIILRKRLEKFIDNL